MRRDQAIGQKWIKCRPGRRGVSLQLGIRAGWPETRRFSFRIGEYPDKAWWFPGGAIVYKLAIDHVCRRAGRRGAGNRPRHRHFHGHRGRGQPGPGVGEEAIAARILADVRALVLR